MHHTTDNAPLPLGRAALSVAAPTVGAMSETSNEVRWTAERVLALAPDAASREAAAGLAAPASWSGAGATADAVWGECRGGGGSAYRTAVEPAVPAYSCTCPSHKVPCKHALGLLLLWASGPGAVPKAERPPHWARAGVAPGPEHLGRPERRGTAGATPADPEAARRRAERRAARVAAGAAELRLRLADRLHSGLAGEEQSGYAGWDDVAARMVDAQAPGLASLVRELASVPASGPGRPSELLERCALLDLLASAYGRIDTLPAPLAATVRSRVGFTVESARLLRGPRVHDRWLVLGARESADDRLTTRRLWLHGSATGRTALLLSFGRPGRVPDLALPVGCTVKGDLAYHPGVRPLRAVLDGGHAPPVTPPPGRAVPPGVTVGGALAAYGTAVAEDPWLDSWPVVLTDVVPVPAADGWRLADADGGEWMPVHRQGATAGPGLWRLAAVSGGRPVTVFGECGHRGFRPLTVWADGTPATALAP